MRRRVTAKEGSKGSENHLHQLHLDDDLHLVVVKIEATPM
jgi:hypothetical protein